MRHTASSWSWLKNLTIVGREEGDDPYERDENNNIVEEDGEKVLKEGYELDEQGNPVKVDDPDDEDDDEGDDGDDPKKLKEKLEAKEKALRQERKLRRQAQREARQAKGKKADDDKSGEDDEAKKQLEAERTKNTRLADRLRKKEIDDAIREAATKLNFIDPTDALIDDVRREIDFDQDKDDPTDIDIDLDSVRDAVKELADRKKHLIGKPGEGNPSGGRFSSRRRKQDDGDNNTKLGTLQSRYPSLQ